jgi:hypothetical protein
MALTFELLREDDLLALRVGTENLSLDTHTADKPLLVRADPAKPAYLTFEFPPQSIAEKAYYEVAAHVVNPANPAAGDDPLDPAGSVPGMMAGGSRLVFKLPTAIKHIPFNINALLDWARWDLVLSPTALGEPLPPPISAPTATQTALELPYRLILSPANRVAWVHATKPVTHAGRTELWHTRAGRYAPSSSAGAPRRIIEADDQHTVPLRAIWSPDFRDHGPLPGDGPWLAALSPRDRAQLVMLTSGTDGYYVKQGGGTNIPWTPKPVQASRLFLSTLGAWLTSRGTWSTQPTYLIVRDGRPSEQTLDISEWDHLATMGRDHYVKVVYEGYLYPLGHRAALVKVTERKVVPANGTTVTYPTAYLKQHMYVIVREPIKSYGSAPYEFAGREVPFWKSVRLRTLLTPDIDKPVPLYSGAVTATSFWINVGGAGYPFHGTATDLAGTGIDFEGPLVFVDRTETRYDLVQQAYAAATITARAFSVSGHKVAYANPADGDVSLKTTGLLFDTQLLQNPPYPQAPFVPTLALAEIAVPVLEAIMGTSDPVAIALYSGYLHNGLDPHAGVFATVVGTQPALTFSAEQAGGFATPNLQVTALSARKGLVAGDPDDAAAGVIQPAAFFPDTAAQLFSTVPLSALIPVDAQGKAPADTNAPEIRTQLLPNARHPTTLVTKVSWTPQLKSYDTPVFSVDFQSTAALTLSAKVTRSLTNNTASAEIKGELTHFSVTLAEVATLQFDSLQFSSKSGQKMHVKADLPANGPITFTGPLSFVQRLAEILPPGLFGAKGPSLQLLSDRIRVTYTFGLPPISVGVLSLEHISIMSGVDLPYFDGKPAFEFAFASRGSPFLITVECLGGGGFVHLVIDTHEVQMVEGALEFGGEFSLDLGVASGGVSIMAGIYFQLTDTSSDITGFVDVKGEVSVLGIISISLELNLSLSWQDHNGKQVVAGRATLTVAVHILFFSASVQISMEKRFGSSNGDPRLGAVLTPAGWADYAAAFA